MILGIIPARGGSKGIPRKNLAPLAGRPLLDYTLEAAQRARTLDHICVSTDDAEIARLARRRGIAVVCRPARFSGDRSQMIQAVLHALDVMKSAWGEPDAVVLLQPTSPLRAARHIDAAVKFFSQRGADSLLSVNPVSQHPCECVCREDGRLKTAAPRPRHAAGRQDFRPYYYVNGAIYVTRTLMLRRRRRFWDSRSELYIMPEAASIDVDEPHHLVHAAALLRYTYAHDQRRAT